MNTVQVMDSLGFGFITLTCHVALSRVKASSEHVLFLSNVLIMGLVKCLRGSGTFDDP